MHAGMEGYRAINSSIETDAVAITVSVLDNVDVEHIWIAFGRGQDFCWIPVHGVTLALGRRSDTAAFSYAFNGCGNM